jgi:hypothetical protein
MSGTKIPYVDIDFRAFRAVTSHFTLPEIGMYLSLLALYLCIGALPKKPATLAELIGCTPEEFANVWPRVRSQCVETASGWRVLIPGSKP